MEQGMIFKNKKNLKKTLILYIYKVESSCVDTDILRPKLINTTLSHAICFTRADHVR